MKNGIVIAIHPFIKNQKVEIYKDNEKIETVNCPLKDLEKTIYTLCKEYRIHEVYTFGGFMYGEKLKKQLEQELKFDFGDIKVFVN